MVVTPYLSGLIIIKAYLLNSYIP